MDESESHNNAGHRKVIHAFVLFIFLWQSLFRISDSAISLMLSFIAKLFSYASTCIGLNGLHRLAKLLPKSLYRARKSLGRLQDTFLRFVSCCTEPDHNGEKASRPVHTLHFPIILRLECMLRVVKNCQELQWF